MNSQFKITFITLFPSWLQQLSTFSVIGKAIQSGRVVLHFVDPRDFATDKYRTVDDAPFGGGPGMVLKPDILERSLEFALKGEDRANTRVVYLSPQGPVWSQDRARKASVQYRHWILICGHYEGIDERALRELVDEEISIGDYILSGGEIPALVWADSVIRILPETLGNPDSVAQDSLEGGLLKAPVYTRPAVWREIEVPPVLRSGDHGAIEAWKKQEAMRVTQEKRPDLLKKGQK